ncbi:hypothetical protein KC323_g83 [Hortaea werneckii]|nr:hypothetical protein KC323_g83 [Hortaea werneckii]
MLHPFERSDINLVLRVSSSRGHEHHLALSVTESDGAAEWHKEAGDIPATVDREQPNLLTVSPSRSKNIPRAVGTRIL